MLPVGLLVESRQRDLERLHDDLEALAGGTHLGSASRKNPLLKVPCLQPIVGVRTKKMTFWNGAACGRERDSQNRRNSSSSELQTFFLSFRGHKW